MSFFQVNIYSSDGALLLHRLAVLAESAEDSYAVGVNWLRTNHPGDFDFTLISSPIMQDGEV